MERNLNILCFYGQNAGYLHNLKIRGSISFEGLEQSNISEQPSQIKTVFLKNLRAEVMERFLSFGEEYFVFQFAIQKYKK
jgi:hypothetical protein